MKVKQLLEFLKTETQNNSSLLEKEVTFCDYETKHAYSTPNIVTCIDLSDDKYLDLVFNYNESEV